MWGSRVSTVGRPVSSQITPEEIQEILSESFSGNFLKARDTIRKLLLKGLSGEDILSQIHREVFNLDIPEEKKANKHVKLERFQEQIKYTLSESQQLLSSLVSHHGRLILYQFGMKRAYLSPHDICLRSFVDDIINDREPYVNAQKGYDCMRIVEDICTHLQKINKK